MTEPRPQENPPRAAVIGGGPAGLMAAEALLARGIAVDLYDAMPSLGRKLLMAGRGGLNLTHAEPLDVFLSRYGPAQGWLAPFIRRFPPQGLRDWAATLGIETFVGTSGRVFPRDFKAAPLLRAWLHRLRGQGLRIHVRHRWTGWTDTGALSFDTPAGPVAHAADATILAFGGGSWPKLGSDGAWVPALEAAGVAVAALRPSNCGFDIGWSPWFRERGPGQPLKSVTLTFDGRTVPGECVITETGIEGGPVYALSGAIRDAIARDGRATLTLDLAPGRTEDALRDALAQPQGGRSRATQLKRLAGIDGVKAALLREVLPKQAFDDPARLAAGIKALPLILARPRPIAEAISSAGGVALDALDDHLMLKARPGTFVAGEMADWEAPTGGYLLTACLALGRAAGDGAADWLAEKYPDRSRFKATG